MRSLVILFAKIAVSGGLLYALYRNTPLGAIQEIIAQANLWYLPVIALLLCLNTVISARKWQLFLHADKVPLSLTELIISYMSGTFCNLFLPSNIGGDSYRIYDIARQSKQVARSAVSVFADRFSGFIALVSLSLFCSIYVAIVLGTAHYILIPALLFSGFAGALVLLFRPALFRTLLRVLMLGNIGLVNRLSDKLLQSFTRYGANRRLLFQVMLLSFVFQGSVILVVYLLACSLGTPVAFIYFGAFVPLISLLEALPISIYGIGLRDYGYVLFFTQVGMGEIETRTLALSFMVLAIVYSLIGGMFFLYKIWRK